MRVAVRLAALLILIVAGGCNLKTGTPIERHSKSNVDFSDVSAEAGITFKHASGARGKKYMPETVGSGCAFLDYDQDGWQDLFFVNSTDWPGEAAQPHYSALYRNNRNGTFTDVTKQAGLAIDVYGQGVAVGDYDNDGLPDLFLTCIGPNHLFRNQGNGTFRDVTAAAGTAGEPVEPGGLRWKWSSSASWFDYDRDGLLDLYVGNYVKWTPATDPYCGSNGKKAYCPPNQFEGVPSLLYRNLGKGRFEDVSERTGIAGAVGKSFGVAVADYDADGWSDLAVSNDTKENFLFMNQKGQRFSEQGVEAAIAFSPGGVPRAGMGIDVADWRNEGRFGLIIGNFSREGLALFSNDGSASFTDVSYPAGVGETSLLSLTFGTFFFDVDLDGRQDIFAANGHIDDFVQMKDATVTYEQLPLMYRGVKGGTFELIDFEGESALSRKRVLRGCSHGDFDNDGDQDIAVVWNNRQGELWRNDHGNEANWIGLVLQGAESNRDALGTEVRVTTGGETQLQTRHSGGSFLSESDGRMVFGLGSSKRADRVEIRWPSGKTVEFRNTAAGKYYRAVEGASDLVLVEVDNNRIVVNQRLK